MLLEVQVVNKLYTNHLNLIKVGLNVYTIYNATSAWAPFNNFGGGLKPYKPYAVYAPDWDSVSTS